MSVLYALVGLLWTSVSFMAMAASDDQAYSRKGADTCLKCHDDARTTRIFLSPHGGQHNAELPFSQQQCEACHGPSGAHGGRYRDASERPPPFAFSAATPTSTHDQNQRCLSCHAGAARASWHESAHGEAELLCSSCHQMHRAGMDSNTDKHAINRQCGSCHGNISAQSLQLSAHPLRQGMMSCSDCHQVHGGMSGDHLLEETNTRDSCLRCHAEKRGPFLWEHAPAAEDCGLCHQAHGSTHPALLNTVKPLLCQSCHSQDGHPSQAFTAGGLANGQPSAFLLLNSCSNCHSQVHGSNHPSGAQLLR